jgi:hypothetical protein
MKYHTAEAASDMYSTFPGFFPLSMKCGHSKKSTSGREGSQPAELEFLNNLWG